MLEIPDSQHRSLKYDTFSDTPISYKSILMPISMPLSLFDIVSDLHTSVNSENRSEFLDWFEENLVICPTDTTLWHVAQEPEMVLWRPLCAYVWKDGPLYPTFTNKTRERIYRDMKAWLLEAIRANYIVE